MCGVEGKGTAVGDVIRGRRRCTCSAPGGGAAAAVGEEGARGPGSAPGRGETDGWCWTAGAWAVGN